MANPPQVEFYKDKRGQYRWRFKASNGRIVADGAQGYKQFAGAIKGFGVFEKAMKCKHETRNSTKERWPGPVPVLKPKKLTRKRRPRMPIW